LFHTHIDKVIIFRFVIPVVFYAKWGEGGSVKTRLP